MATIEIDISKKIFNDVYIPYLDNLKDRYLVFYGGGSSGKSYFIGQRYIYKMLKDKINLLVVRKVSNTNRLSTYPLLKSIINKWNLTKYFKFNESDLKITCLLNGNEVVFAGLDDVEKLKSITFQNGELTDIWVEEATETTEEDINQLKIRLRGGKSKKQMVLSFNPININHWIKKHFIDSKLATALHTTYKDNKFLTKEDKKVLEGFKETDQYYYQVYCIGQWGVLGQTIFNANKVNQRLLEIKKPLKVGFFKYDYDGLKISNIKWVNADDGYIKIYETPNIYKYAVGGDTAGEGSDYFTGQVIDARTGNQVAVLRHQMDEDLYTKQIYCLGVYYKNALIGIESNFSTYPIKELERLGYKNMYVREREDTYTGRLVKAYGFKTTSLTRPLIIAELIQIVRENIEIFNDKETLEEMLTFVRNEKGRPEAQQGSHDDLIMGIAIAHYIKTQVQLKEEPIITPYQFQFESEKPKGKDWGERITIV